MVAIDLSPDLVKGLAHDGEKLPPATIPAYKEAAEKAFAEAIDAGHAGRAQADLQKAVGNDQSFASMLAESGMGGLAAVLTKDFTQQSPVSGSFYAGSGLVPFDLQAPAALMYPVFSPLRNKLPRTKGQGSASIRKRITDISGTGTGTMGFKNPFQSEFPSGKTIADWPAGVNTVVSAQGDDLIVPYRIMALDNSASWVAQYMGAGFEDINALATLQLLQSMMMSEEAAILSAQDTALTAPTIASVTPRTAGSGETQVSAGPVTIWVKATAVNMFGETAGGAAVSASVTAGQVADVLITDVTAAQNYNVYVSSGGSDPGDASRWLAGATGWKRFTIQGSLPTSASPAIPSADSGTGTGSGPQRYNGLIPILAGTTASQTIYDPKSRGLNTGYTYRHNGGTGSTPAAFGINDVQTALLGMWNARKARPSEAWFNATDRKVLSDSILAAGAQTAAYRIITDPNGAGSLKASAVVTAIWNEATGDEVALTMHPYLLQGNALIMSYSLPFPNGQVANTVEIRNVLDYLAVAWPQIDARFRHSIYTIGSLVANAPQYCGLIQGIPKSAVAPYA